MVIAAFGNKIFSVSSNKINTFDGLAYSGELQTEAQDVAGQKPSTYIKGDGLMPVSMELDLKVEFGLNVRAEIDNWQKVRAAAIPQFLNIGGKPLSVNRFLLKSVSVSEVKIDGRGGYRSAKVALTFEEYVRAGSAEASKKTKKKSTKSEKKRENINALVASANNSTRKGVVKE